VNNLDILHIFQPIVILFALLGLYVISHSALYIFPGSILKFVIIIFFWKKHVQGRRRSSDFQSNKLENGYFYKISKYLQKTTK